MLGPTIPKSDIVITVKKDQRVKLALDLKN